jgi:predicted nucleic acid-binding protein
LSDRPHYVIDASVVARWCLFSPPYVDHALKVLDDYQEARIDLIAPDNLRYEVGGAIHQAVIARYLQASQGEEQFRVFLGWQIPTVDMAQLLLSAYRLSIRLGCSFYDAVYLVLSEAKSLPFIFADRRLRNALGNRFPLALWIEDYQPA